MVSNNENLGKTLSLDFLLFHQLGNGINAFIYPFERNLNWDGHKVPICSYRRWVVRLFMDPSIYIHFSFAKNQAIL